MDETHYTNLEEAKEEILKRRKDASLLKLVEETIDEIPESFKVSPRAVLFRNIISPTTEFLYFLEQAKKINLNPLGIEHTKDKFSTRNQDKMLLAKLALIRGKDKNGNHIIQKRKIIDIKANDNKPFREILTIGNESLPHFHHCLLRNYLDQEEEIIDLSDWLNSHGKGAVDYYEKFLSLFICHGILFETFVTNKSEAEFADKVVLPAYEAVHKKYGLKPLIVKSIDERKDINYWTSYPGDLQT